jgi:hypothetical protein
MLNRLSHIGVNPRTKLSLPLTLLSRNFNFKSSTRSFTSILVSSTTSSAVYRIESRALCLAIQTISKHNINNNNNKKLFLEGNFHTLSSYQSNYLNLKNKNPFFLAPIMI